MRRLRGIFLLLGGMAFCAASQAEVTELTVTGPYTQPLSGMVYPVKVDDFARTSVQQYKPDGSDVSAGYIRMQPGAEIVATAYSSPMPALKPLDGETPDKTGARICQAVAGDVVKAVAQANPTSKTVAADLVTLDQGGPQHGFHAVFSQTAPKFLGRANEAVGSQAYVFCTGKWVVEYRFTYPAAAPDVGGPIAAFMADLKWTYAPADAGGGAPPAAATANGTATPGGAIIVAPGVLTKVNQHSRPGQGKDWPVTITIVSPPAHGTVTSQTAMTPVTNSSGAARTVAMTQVFYQSAPGYAGADSFTYKRTTEDPADPNNAKPVTMTINVVAR